MRRVLVTLCVSVLLFGGCDDDAGDSVAPVDPPTSTTGAQDPSTSTTDPNATPGSTIDTTFSEPGDERFCELARSYVEQFTGRAAPGEARAFGEALQEAQSIVLEMQDVAPAEIVADLLIVTDVLGVVVPALEEVDFDLSQIPPDELERLQDPDFQASSARLQAYVENACKPV
jgi:hypothetical protein